jgi:hypothetical protein
MREILVDPIVEITEASRGIATTMQQTGETSPRKAEVR